MKRRKLDEDEENDGTFVKLGTATGPYATGRFVRWHLHARQNHLGVAAVDGITVTVGETESTLPQSVSATVSTVSIITAEDGSQSEKITVAQGEAVPVTWALPEGVAFSSETADAVFTYTASLSSDNIYTPWKRVYPYPHSP